MDARAVWVVLPGRMPGMPVWRVAHRMGVSTTRVTAVLERLVTEGRVIRRPGRVGDVYYRSYWPEVRAVAGCAQPSLFDEVL